MAREYRLDGRVVDQRTYLDDKARKAGFPGGRKEREAFRRGVQRALKTGAARPSPPTGRASYRPASEAPKAVSARRRGKRYSVGGVGEYLATSGVKTAEKEIRRAAKRGSNIVLTVTADAIVFRYPQPWSNRKATLVGVAASEIVDAINAFGGDLEAAVSYLISATGDYEEVSGITLYEIKTY